MASSKKSSKYHVIFIPGLCKPENDFDTSSNGKALNIVQKISQKYDTTTVSFYDGDYSLSSTDFCKIYFDTTPIDVNKKIIIVAHSYGCFYAMRMAELYPLNIVYIILLDPVIKSDSYKTYLIKELESETDAVKRRIRVGQIDNYDDLSDGSLIKPSVTVKIRINIDSDSDPLSVFDKIHALSTLTKKNIRSELIVHTNIGHMIHYKIPESIINDVLEYR